MTDTTPANDLRRIADLIDQGLPAPISITGMTYGPTAVLIFAEDLPDWLVALDAPEPEWTLGQSSDLAEFADVTVDGLRVRSCRDVQPTEDEFTEPLFDVEATTHG